MSYEVKENAYGHLKRVKWFQKRLKTNESICEIGCGTGAMIVFPLAKMGYNAETAIVNYINEKK